MVSDKFRFAAVISHPIQHYSPLFRALAKVPGIHVKVFYLCDHGVRDSFDPGFGQSFSWDVPLLEGYDYEILKPGFSPKKFGFFEVDFSSLKSRLDSFSPHAIWIHGYGQMIAWQALQWAKNRAAIIYFGDSELLHKRKFISRLLKYLPLKYFFRHCDAFLTIGERNEEYYLHYGVTKEKLHRGACPVDVERFRKTLQSYDRPNRAEIRKGFGLSEDAFVAITLGKLIPIKRPLDIVEAIAQAKKKQKLIYTLMIGDGPLRKDIEKKAKEHGITDQVKITGFVNQKDIPYYIEAGDILAILSEKDPHPLAVTESLTAGLPVVISDRVGCVGPTDTARPGINALVYPCGNIPALTEALCLLSRDTALKQRMSRASLEIAPSQDIHVTVNTLLQILLLLKNRFANAWSDVSDNILHDFEKYISTYVEIGSIK